MVSIHAPREGSDDLTDLRVNWQRLFQSTLPVKGATRRPDRHLPQGAFQSTLPVKGATRRPDRHLPQGAFQSTLPVKGATLLGGALCKKALVSIHAPREGSDQIAIICQFFQRRFNPRSP